MSRAAFCRLEGLCYATVSQWVKGEQAVMPTNTFALVEVESEGSILGDGLDVTVELPGSVKVRFGRATGMGEIVRFCREVSQC